MNRDILERTYAVKGGLVEYTMPLGEDFSYSVPNCGLIVPDLALDPIITVRSSSSKYTPPDLIFDQKTGLLYLQVDETTFIGSIYYIE